MLIVSRTDEKPATGTLIAKMTPVGDCSVLTAARRLFNAVDRQVAISATERWEVNETNGLRSAIAAVVQLVNPTMAAANMTSRIAAPLPV